MLVYLGAPPPRVQAAYSQRVRAGSTSSFVDSSANTWSADRAYTPGGFGYTTGDPYATGAAIAGTPDGPLFQTNRHAGSFAYQFDVPNGAYQVRVRFAEIYPGAFGIGRRVFNVAVEGAPVVQNFDIFARVGANTALDSVFTTNVLDGVLSIDFTGVVTHAAVSAIEVVAVGGSTPGTPTATPTLTPTATATRVPTFTPTPLPTATATPVPAGSGTQTVTFDELGNPNRTLNGQYPSALIDWGSNAWYLSGPWGSFRTNSIGFSGAGPTSASFTFLSPRRLVQIDAYNGGNTTSTVSLACVGQATRQVTLAARQTITITSGWAAACARVTLSSSNGWNTNFDSLVLDSGTPDFMFSASPASMTMGLTGNVQYSATLEMTGGFSPASIGLWVTGLPSGVQGVFTPNPLPHEGTSTLILTGDGTAAAGSYPITLGATAESVSHSQVVTLVVISQPDFSLSVSPLGQDVSAGGLSVDYDVRLTPLNQFTDPVSLSLTGLPVGVTATYSPQPLTSSQSSLITVTALASAAQGTYQLLVVGSAGPLSRSTPITLGVRAGRVWSVDAIGTTGTQNNSALVGPGRNDGVNRVYVGTVDTGRVQEFSWTGSGWGQGVDIGGSPGGGEIHNMGMGAGRNDGITRIYACSLDGELYELTYASSSWAQSTVGSAIGYCTHAAVGAGRNDGVNRLYATRDRYTMEYTWSGSAWSAVTVGSIPSGLAHGVWIGPGRGGSTNYLYVATTNSGTYEGSYAAGAWALDAMGDRGDVRNVSVGPGRNDGTQRVYSATANGELREFTWSGSAWASALAGTPIAATMIHANVADGRGDGVLRVYTSAADGAVREHTFVSGAWTTSSLGGGTGYLYGFHLGVGRNDGRLRLYGASFDHLVYEYDFGN
ncbi:MAG TPA: malectin domain-containing carbohydrate-binding protein [Chloroflexota bacterium]